MTPTTATTGIPAGFSQSSNQAHLRKPQRSATVEGRVTDITRGDGAYMTGARNRGRTEAMRRGFANVGASSAAAEQAGLQAALPIASQDAQTFAQAESQNQDALNAFEAEKIRRQEEKDQISFAANQMSGAVYHGAQADAAATERRYQHERDMSEAERLWRTQERLGGEDYGREGWQNETAAQREDRLWRTGEREGTQDYGRDMTREDQGFRARQADFDRIESRWARNFDAGTAAQMGVLSTIMSDPAYFDDPESAAGFMEFFSNTFGRISERYFGG